MSGNFVWRNKKIMEELTQEQQDLIPVVKDKWLSFFFNSTGKKIDTEAVDEGIEMIYKMIEKDKPKIHYASSPWQAQELANEINGTKNEFENVLSDPAPDQIDCMEKDEMKVLIQKAFAKLPEKQRTVVILKEYQALKFSEIAEIMNSPVGTIKSLNHRGHQKLKKILAKYVD